jgi:sulfur carrier protein ThiS
MRDRPVQNLRRSVILREIRRGLGRFRHVSPIRLLTDIARAVRLQAMEPSTLPVPARPERLIVSMTTIPGRASRIVPVLRSLLDQSCPADRILLAWPSHSRRTNAPYPVPPALPAGVELLACEDQGPATKLLAALQVEPETAIVAVDDDVVYPKDFLETLLKAHRAEPKTAWGYRGWQLEQNTEPRDLDHVFATAITAPKTVDVLLGTWGYLIPPNAFDKAVYDFDRYPPELRWVDDVWFSGHLAMRGVPRCVVPAAGFPIETVASFLWALTDGPNRNGRNDMIAIDTFKAWW